MKKDKQIQNILLAITLWLETPKESVGLSDWRYEDKHGCSTYACFGGHLATWPEFQDMGVATGLGGAPTLNGEVDPFLVSYKLFGTSKMFFPANGCSTRGYPAHRTILYMLENQLNSLLEAR